MSKEQKNGFVEIVVVFLVVYSESLLANYLWRKYKINGKFLTIASSLLMSVSVALYIKLKKVDLKKFGFWKQNLLRQIGWGVFAFFCNFAVFVLLPIAGGNAHMVLGKGAESFPQLVMMILLYFFCVALAEELVFRGYLYYRITELSENEALAVLVTSFLFGVAHFKGILYFGNVFSAGMAGAFWGICRYKFKNCSLLSLIIAHGLHDSMIDVLSYVMHLH